MTRRPPPRPRQFAERSFPLNMDTPAQRPSAYRGSFYSPPPQLPTIASQRPSASRDFPPQCGNAHERLDLASSARRRVSGSIPRAWLQSLLFEQAGDGEAVDPTPLPATDDNDDLMSSDVDADVDDLVSATESYDDGGDDISPFVDDYLLFSSGIDGYLSYDDDDGLPEEVVSRFMNKMSCEEVAAAGDGDTGVCAVCQDDLCGEDRKDVGVLGCLHRFHADCVGKWLQMKNVCPLCKTVCTEITY